MQCGALLLTLCELPVLWVDFLDVALRLRPDRVAIRDHLDHEVFKLTRALVVRHQPNADPLIRADDCAAGLGFVGQCEFRCQTIANSLPPRRWIVIRVDENADDLSARYFDFNTDRLEQRIDAAPVLHIERWKVAQNATQAVNGAQIIAPFDQQHPISILSRFLAVRHGFTEPRCLARRQSGVLLPCTPPRGAIRDSDRGEQAGCQHLGVHTLPWRTR